jgi:MFS family permease
MAQKPERAFFKRYGLPPDWGPVFSVVAICAVMSAVMRVSIDGFAVFLLPLSEEFGWARSEVVSIYGLSMFSFGVGCLLAGRAIDRLGPRWTYTLGLALLAAVFLSAGYFEAHWQFSLGMGVCVGLGAAMVGMVSHAALMSRWFAEHLTFALSITFAASGFGMLIGAPILQALIEMDGWRHAYSRLGCVIAALALIMPLLPWARLQARDREAHLTQVRDNAGKPRLSLKQLMSQPGLTALFTIQFLTAVSLFALNPQIVALLVEQGFPPVWSAVAFGAAGFAGATGVIVFGWLADRQGRRFAMTLSFVMTTVGFSILLLLIASPSWVFVVLFVLIYGPTFGSRGPIVNAMVPAMVGRGPGLGLKIGFVQLGMGLGAAVGAVSGGWLRDVSGYQGVILLAIIAGLLALTLFLTAPSIRRLAG